MELESRKYRREEQDGPLQHEDLCAGHGSGDQAHISYVSCIGRWVLYHSHRLGNPQDTHRPAKSMCVGETQPTWAFLPAPHITRLSLIDCSAHTHLPYLLPLSPSPSPPFTCSVATSRVSSGDQCESAWGQAPKGPWSRGET